MTSQTAIGAKEHSPARRGWRFMMVLVRFLVIDLLVGLPVGCGRIAMPASTCRLALFECPGSGRRQGDARDHAPVGDRNVLSRGYDADPVEADRAAG
jgi:hypothetical protein